MAHFAEIDENNIVLRVLVVPNEYEATGEKYLAEDLGMGGTWIQTSYNAKIRGKYAGVGDTYDATLDRFIAKKPYASWKLGDDFEWHAPKPKPVGEFYWNEELGDWEEIAQTV